MTTKAPLITSTANTRIKAVASMIAKRSTRDDAGLFAVEGAREIGRALQCLYVPTEFYVCPEALSPAAQSALASASSTIPRHEVTPTVYAKLAVREGSDGLIAVFRQRASRLSDLRLPPEPLILAVQGIEKPGNLGALLRSADGAGANAVIILGKAVDLYNPHVVRTSLGTVFSVPVAHASSAELSAYCAAHSLRVVAAALDPRAVPHHQANLRGSVVLLLGEEATGLSSDWLERADQIAQIPMRGIADSLNVAAAGGILLYEALRQRL